MFSTSQLTRWAYDVLSTSAWSLFIQARLLVSRSAFFFAIFCLCRAKKGKLKFIKISFLLNFSIQERSALFTRCSWAWFCVLETSERCRPKTTCNLIFNLKKFLNFPCEHFEASSCCSTRMFTFRSGGFFSGRPENNIEMSSAFLFICSHRVTGTLWKYWVKHETCVSNDIIDTSVLYENSECFWMFNSFFVFKIHSLFYLSLSSSAASLPSSTISEFALFSTFSSRHMSRIPTRPVLSIIIIIFPR